MSNIDSAAAELRSLDELARRDTALTRIDARAKLITTLCFVLVTVSFDRYRVAGLLPLAMYPLCLAALGEIPLRPLARKLAFAAPFALMVGIFNPWLDRAPLLFVGSVPVSGGWLSFASIVLRFALTVGACLVLVAGTGMQPLCAALARIGAPREFTVQLLFLYRYAFVLAAEAARMDSARRLRANGRPMRIGTYGAAVGHLLLRACERAQRIHLAMLARGFDGELRAPSAPRWRGRDTHFVLGWCAYFALVRAFDLPQALGRLALGAAA
ncbi:MAG: cobalt ECF transporter T component CbiQ [Rhodocyclaceae bacterium]